MALRVFLTDGRSMDFFEEVTYKATRKGDLEIYAPDGGALDTVAMFNRSTWAYWVDLAYADSDAE